MCDDKSVGHKKDEGSDLKEKEFASQAHKAFEMLTLISISLTILGILLIMVVVNSIFLVKITKKTLSDHSGLFMLQAVAIFAWILLGIFFAAQMFYELKQVLSLFIPHIFISSFLPVLVAAVLILMVDIGLVVKIKNNKASVENSIEKSEF